MNRAARLAFYLAVVLAVGLPLFSLGLWSFSARWFFPSPWPSRLGLRAWEYIFSPAGSQVLGALGVSLALAGVTATLSTALGLGAGRALGAWEFRGKRLVVFAFALPLVIPPLAVTLGLHLWFLRLGLAETFLGLAAVHLVFCLPYPVFVFFGVFAGYDPAYEEQAMTLGASRRATLFGVTLRLVGPGLATAFVFSFLLSWSQYLSTLVVGGGKMATLPIALFALMNSGDRPVAAAVCLVFILPAFGCLAVAGRYLSHAPGRRARG